MCIICKNSDPSLLILSSSSRIMKIYTSKVRRRKEISDNANGLKVAKGKGKKSHTFTFRQFSAYASWKGSFFLFAISKTVSSPIMHIWGHLLHTLTQQNSSSKRKKPKKGWRFPWISSAIAFHCVVISFYVFWLKKSSCRHFDSVNANKSIIYNSRTDLSLPGLWWCEYAKTMRKFEFCNVRLGLR